MSLQSWSANLIYSSCLNLPSQLIYDLEPCNSQMYDLTYLVEPNMKNRLGSLGPCSFHETTRELHAL